MPGRFGIRLGGDRVAFPAAYTVDAEDLHQPFDLVPAPRLASPVGGLPQLAATVQPAVGDPQVEQLVGRIGVIEFGIGRPETTLGVGPVGARGDRDFVLGQHGTDRLDPETIRVLADVGDHCPSLRSSSAAAKNADAVFRISFARRN